MEAARVATEDDIARVAELCSDARGELAPMRGGEVFLAREARGKPLEESLRAALSDDDRGLWAGTIDDTIIGYALARVERLRDGMVLGVIEELFAEEEARSVGVGEALMNEVLAWCRARGCSGVDAYALPGHRATKNFFEESGFTARLLVMHHKIPTADG